MEVNGLSLDRQIKSGLDDIKNEIKIMKQLNHQNIITLFEIIDDPKQNKIFIGNIFNQ